MHNEKAESESPLPSPFAPLAPPPEAGSPIWDVLIAFFNWAGSMVFSLVIPLFFTLIYGGLVALGIVQGAKIGQMTKPLALLFLIGLFGGQVLSLLLSWRIVTQGGKRSFGDALGLQWGANFRLPHAFVLGVGMFLVSLGISYVLPKHETDIDILLKFGLLVRIVLAIVATVGAPIQEEIVYRGVLYTALEKLLGARWGVIIVSLLFGLVHVFQYWKSPAALSVVFLLSFVLTGLRAWTGKLLPCIAAHLVFNGIQGVLIVFAPEKTLTPEPTAQPALLFQQIFGY